MFGANSVIELFLGMNFLDSCLEKPIVLLFVLAQTAQQVDVKWSGSVWNAVVLQRHHFLTFWSNWSQIGPITLLIQNGGSDSIMD